MNQKIYKFEDFHLDQNKRQLFHEDTPIFLSARAFEILSLLVENSGQIVNKETLFEKVWADSFVEENNLPVHISILRRIFKEKSADGNFIKTVSGRGYTFAADVQLLTDTEVSPQTVVNQRKTLTPAQAIAVLPFAHAAENQSLKYLANGVTQNLIDDLSQISNLKVLAYSAVKDFRTNRLNFNDIRFLLGATKILTGEISEFQGKLEINVELIDADDQTHLWGIQQTFEPDELFQLRKEISLKIAEKLKLQFSPTGNQQVSKPQNINHEAEKLYFRGKFVLESRFASKDIRETLELAIRYFQRAVNIEPRFPAAYVGIGMAYVSLFNHYSNFAENYPKAKQALQMALALDETFSQAYVLKASIETFFEKNYGQASKSLDRAIEFNSNNADAYHWKGIIHTRFGEFDKAIEMETKAIGFDPLSPRFNPQLMRIHYWAGNYHKAIALAEEILEITPHREDCHLFLAQSYGFLGMHEKSLEEIDIALKLRKNSEVYFCKASLLALAARRSEAEQLVADTFSQFDDHEIDYADAAIVYAVLNDPDKSFGFIDQALSKGSTNLDLFKIDPRFANLRSDPRFETYLRKLKLI